MLDVLDDFVEELRAAGLPISARETIDASEALLAIPLDDKDVLEAALGATLVKSYEHLEIFRTAFAIYFSRRQSDVRRVDGLEDVTADADRSAGDPSASDGSGVGERYDAESLRALAREALLSGQSDALVGVARIAVALFAGVDPGRPVGVSYYLQRTLRALDLESLLASILASAGELDDSETSTPSGTLSRRLVKDEYASRAEAIRALIEEEIRRRLIEGRGAQAVARSLRRSLLEDVDFMHASSLELAAMRRAIAPLARLLAARLARRRHHGRRGALDFRATMRRSLSSGGVPIELRFRPPHPVRPELFVFADLSGSVAAFARFTVQLVYAIAMHFSGVRTVVFIDGIDEVTHIFKTSSSIEEATRRMAEEADVVASDGHSDYGRALVAFSERFLPSITSRTNVLILGDGRNNYHLAHEEVLGELKARARRVLWLNPEPASYWGVGDSIAPLYAKFCDEMFECRNLRQLKSFVSELV